MTAGLSYDVFSEPIQTMQRESGKHATTREVARAIAEMPLIAEPGTRFSYGLGHDVLAAGGSALDAAHSPSSARRKPTTARRSALRTNM